MPRDTDLTAIAEPTLVLLSDTRIWRQRLVETFTFHDATHVRVESSYQVELPPTFVERFATGGVDSLNLLVPVTTRPKRTLVNFDARSGGGRELFLLPRAAIADIESLWLEELCATGNAAAADLRGLTEDLLYGIAVFTPGPWHQFLANYGHEPDLALAHYLWDGLGLTFTGKDLTDWERRACAAGRLLVEALEEPPDPSSSSENVLLALPGLARLPRTSDDVTAIVDGFCRAVEHARRADAQRLLSTLAEYGRRWEVIVEVEVPASRPTMLRLVEDRPLALDAQGTTVQRVALGDAGSSHFEARVTDHHVTLQDFELKDLSGQPVGVPVIESWQLDPETLSMYTSLPERPYYVDIRLRLKLAAYVRWTIPGAFALTVTAVIGLLLVQGEPLPDRLALLLFPATLAVAFILTREETPLAAALHRRWQMRLAGAVTTLWLVALGRVLVDDSVVPDPVWILEQWR